MRAVEAGNTDLQKEIAAKKQALRDVPQTFSAPEEVVWPEKPE